MMDPRAVLQRLRDPSAGHSARLARLIADDLARRPLADLVDTARLAAELRRWLQALTRDTQAIERLVDRISPPVTEARARLRGEPRRLAELVPSQVQPPLRELLATPWSPSEALTLRLINHASVRTLLASILSTSLQSFVQRARGMEEGLLGGLAGKAVQRGRGLFGGLAQGLSSATEGIVAAVRAEIEQAMESRIQPFVGQASEDAIRSIAAWISDPAHAGSIAELRLAVLDALLDTQVGALVREVDAFDSRRVIGVLVGSLAEAVSGDAAAEGVEAQLRHLLDVGLRSVGDGTLAGALDELGLAQTWSEAVDDLGVRGAPVVDAVLGSEAFEAWWLEVCR